MSDEDLEVLITLDDPWYGPDEDTFHHLQPGTDLKDWTRSIGKEKADGNYNMLFAFI